MKLSKRYNNVLKGLLTADAFFLDIKQHVTRHGEQLLHPDGQHFSNSACQVIGEQLIEIIVRTGKVD